MGYFALPPCAPGAFQHRGRGGCAPPGAAKAQPGPAGPSQCPCRVWGTPDSARGVLDAPGAPPESPRPQHLPVPSMAWIKGRFLWPESSTCARCWEGTVSSPRSPRPLWGLQCPPGPALGSGCRAGGCWQCLALQPQPSPTPDPSEGTPNPLPHRPPSPQSLAGAAVGLFPLEFPRVCAHHQL